MKENQAAMMEDLIPLPPLIYYVLFTLIGEELHGYEIMKRVEDVMMKDVPAATLYRSIRRMLTDGLIDVAEPAGAEVGDPRRRYYALTPFGIMVYDAETEMREKLARAVRIQRPGAKPVWEGI